MKKHNNKYKFVKKRLIPAILVLTTTFSLAGCVGTVEMTDEQEDQIVEYIAGTMLKYSYANAWDYTKVRKRIGYYENKYEPVTQAPTQTVAPSTSATQSGEASETKVYEGGDALSNTVAALGLEECTITFDGFVSGSKYPTTELAVSVPANEGCKVVAAEFTITNNSGVANTITTKGAASMKLVIGEETISQYVSPLINDVGSMTNVRLGDKENYKIVAVFQVKENLVSQLENAKLQVFKGSTQVAVFPQ